MQQTYLKTSYHIILATVMRISKLSFCLAFTIEQLLIETSYFYFQLKVPYDLKKLIVLKDSGFRSSLKLNKTSQYDIIDTYALVVSGDRKYDVVILLRRMYMYHVTNTYLPTVTLLIISEITLFFDEKNLQVVFQIFQNM